MSTWPASKAGLVLKALQRIGWTVARESGSHKVLTRPGWPPFVFAFHDRVEIGPRMLARIAKHTGLTPQDLQVTWLSNQPMRSAGPHPEADESDRRVRVLPALIQVEQ